MLPICFLNFKVRGESLSWERFLLLAKVQEKFLGTYMFFKQRWGTGLCTAGRKCLGKNLGFDKSQRSLTTSALCFPAAVGTSRHWDAETLASKVKGTLSNYFTNIRAVAKILLLTLRWTFLCWILSYWVWKLFKERVCICFTCVTRQAQLPLTNPSHCDPLGTSIAGA